MTATLGRYEILAPLARGGMAEVFLARRRSGGGIEKRLVIKRIRSEQATNPEMMSLFVREARVSMALSHQNIVPVFDFGRAEDALFLAMEYVDGRDLGAVLSRTRERGERMHPTLIAAVGSECCAALAYAHGRRFDELIGVVHRDVTPRNILLSWSGEVRLTDFGVAVLRRDEVGGAVRGTPSYMAPEQARAEDVDGRADLYALGLVLWEAATGVRVRGIEPHAALAAARKGTLPELPADLPPELAKVIARATAARPEDRYPDARAMQDDLDRAALATRGDRAGAPSRLLADWLATLFDDSARATPDERPSPMDAVTFLDDGEAALLGDSTARSMAGTRAETEPPVATPPPPRPRADPGRRAAILGAVVAMVLVSGVAITWRLMGSSDRRADATAPPDGRPRSIDAAPRAPDAAPTADAAPAADAAPVPIDARAATPPVDAAPRPRVDAGPKAPDAALATRRVTIGSRPWSKFYVDGASTGHETPETIDLAPGPHKIRFVNEAARVDRTITLDVPADRDLKHVEVLVPEQP